VTLVWTAASDNSGIVAGYLVYRADATGVYSFVDTVGGGANQLTITDFTASPGTAYSYKIVAFDAARNYSDASNIATVTTPPLANPADVNPPNTPVGLAIKWFTDTQVSIQWVQSTKTNQNGAVFPASGYYVYRNDQLIATVTGTSYIDTTQAATDYTYYIKAFDYAANVSPASTPITVRTLATAGAVLPAAPTGLVLAAATYNTVTLSWTASATAGVTYNIYRGADLVATGITSTQYSDSSVTPSSGYNYRVTAANAAGESTPSNILAVTVPANPNASQTAPSVPQNFALVTAATSTSVNLTWAPSTKSDGDGIIAGYDILRGDSTGSNFTVIDSVRTPGYTDTSVLPATTYTYKIDAFSTAGTRSAFSATITVTTALPVDTTDLTPPTAPTNLTLNSVTSSAVDLVWTASATSATGKKAAGYKVYRDGAQIADVATLEFVDATVAASSTYAYTVKSYDALGILSDSSNQVVATTPAQTTSTFSVSGRVTLNGIGLQGVVLTITGAGSGSTVTDTNGNYSFTQVRTGRYNVTPTLTPYQFQPGNQSVAVTIANVFAIDFAAAIPGSVTGNITYPVTSITSGILYPNGTIVNGITYPNSQVIGGITYPTSTVIGGVTYPTGAVTGGVSYPNGVVIGGVTYPPGTVVGGVAYPPGTVIGGVTYPPGTVSGGVGYPNGTVSGGVGYPNGMANGIVTYPDSAVTTSFLWSSIVTGRVVDNANSGAALPGATLTITDTTSTPVVTTITSGATGGYTFEGLANHSYTITASLGARTFVPATVTIGPVSGTGGIINVANIVAQ
jgi:chitodextrinase